MERRCNKERLAYAIRYNQQFGKPINVCEREKMSDCESIFAKKFPKSAQKELINRVRLLNKSDNLERELANMIYSYLTFKHFGNLSANQSDSQSDSQSSYQSIYNQMAAQEKQINTDDESGNGQLMLAIDVGEYGPFFNLSLSDALEEQFGLKSKSEQRSTGQFRIDRMSNKEIVSLVRELNTKACLYGFCVYPRFLVMSSKQERKKYLKCGSRKCWKSFQLVKDKFRTFVILMRALNLDPLLLLQNSLNSKYTEIDDDIINTGDEADGDDDDDNDNDDNANDGDTSNSNGHGGNHDEDKESTGNHNTDHKNVDDDENKRNEKNEQELNFNFNIQRLDEGLAGEFSK